MASHIEVNDEDREEIARLIKEGFTEGKLDSDTKSILWSIDISVMSAAEDTNRHVPVYCSIKGCKNEADRWYNDPKYPNETRYVCLEHPRTARAEERGDGHIINSEGRRVDFGVYACSEDCDSCNS